MTHEEAIAIIRKEYLCVDRDCDIERSCGKCDLMMPSKEPILQAYKMAIQALEQEPCEDAISRKALISHIENQIREWGEDYDAHQILGDIEDLPSVKPQTGHWIYTPKRRLVDETDEGGIYTTDYRCTCSECGGDFGFKQMSDAYCKYCGVRMIKSQESEE